MATSATPSRTRSNSFSEWLDRQSSGLFITPAVVLILVFSIFPLVASLIIAFSRMRLRAGSYQVRWVGLKNFEKQFFGSEQFHFLGTLKGLSIFGWVFAVVIAAALLWWLYRYCQRQFWWLGFIGRIISAAVAFGLALLFAATVLSGNQFGTLGVTLFMSLSAVLCSLR